jgi:hypothetical protein
MMACSANQGLPYDESRGGLIANDDDDGEADFEVDINESEPLFLRAPRSAAGSRYRQLVVEEP